MITSTKAKDPLVAANIADMDLSTRTKALYEQGEAWIKLEFDRINFIRDVTIYFWFSKYWYDDEWCALDADSMKHCADEQSNLDVSVYQGEDHKKSCGIFNPTAALEQSDQIYTLSCYVRGDTVKLSRKTNGNIVLFEIAVTAKPGKVFS